MHQHVSYYARTCVVWFINRANPADCRSMWEHSVPTDGTFTLKRSKLAVIAHTSNAYSKQ